MSDFPPLFGAPDMGLIISPDSVHGPFSGMLGSSYLDTAWPAANDTIFVPVRLSVPVIVTQFFVANGATVAGNIDVGIYLPDGTRILSKGATAMSGASAVQTLDVTDTGIGPGLCYIAFTCSSATASFLAHTPSQNSDLVLIGIVQQASAMPATATFATFTDGYVPLFGATTRSLV